MQLKINKDSMKNFANERLFVGIVQIVLGIALIMLRQFAFDFLIMGVGGLIAILGLVLIIGVVRRPKEFVEWYSFILPVLSILLGLYCLLAPTTVIRIIALIIGIFVIIKGVVNIFTKDQTKEKKKYFLISNILTIILGIIIVTTLNRTDALFAIFLAIDLILSGVVDFLMYIDAKKLIKASGENNNINIEV
ncbi:MAG: DUF308 domain-containing protein [Lachnospirales bacterium]